MQVVCEATQNPSVPVQVGAFECLVKIMSLYYDKMNYYMERALFGVCLVPLRVHADSDLLSPLSAHRHGHEAQRARDRAPSYRVLVNSVRARD